MTDYVYHANIFGKSCFSCKNICADTEPEDTYTHYWCEKEKRIIMKRIAVINSFCIEWEVKKEGD